MTPTTTPAVRTAPPTRHELEASLEAYFSRAVRMAGGRAVKLAPTEKGLPDRLVLLPGGRMYLCELKTHTGRVSAAQQLWHDRAGQMGTQVHLLVGRPGIDLWLRARAEELPAVRSNGTPVRPYSSNR